MQLQGLLGRGARRHSYLRAVPYVVHASDQPFRALRHNDNRRTPRPPLVRSLTPRERSRAARPPPAAASAGVRAAEAAQRSERWQEQRTEDSRKGIDDTARKHGRLL